MKFLDDNMVCWKSPSFIKPKQKYIFLFSEFYLLLFGLDLLSLRPTCTRCNYFIMFFNLFALAFYLALQIMNLWNGHYSMLTLIPFGLNISNVIVCFYLILYRKRILKLNELFQRFLGLQLSVLIISISILIKVFSFNFFRLSRQFQL